MKKLKIIKKYWVKKQNDDIQSTILLCTFGSLKWESKEGYATEEIREIIKSLANRKDLVTKFPNISLSLFFCNANPNQQGLSGFTWMTTLETHTPGKDVHVWERVKQQKGCVLWSVLGFSPKCIRGKQGDTKRGGGGKGRGALHQMCINQHKRCISLQPWSTSVPAELLQLIRHHQNYFLKKGSYLSLDTVLSHDMKCYCNKQSHRNQNWNVNLQNKFLGHTYRHRSGNSIFIFKALCICECNCAGGEGYQNLKLF